jgi:hypothetical protein
MHGPGALTNTPGLEYGTGRMSGRLGGLEAIAAAVAGTEIL